MYRLSIQRIFLLIIVQLLVSVHLLDASLGCAMNAFQKGKYAYKMYTSFFVRSPILQKFSCFILFCHLVVVVCK